MSHRSRPNEINTIRSDSSPVDVRDEWILWLVVYTLLFGASLLVCTSASLERKTRVYNIPKNVTSDDAVTCQHNIPGSSHVGCKEEARLSKATAISLNIPLGKWNVHIPESKLFRPSTV